MNLDSKSRERSQAVSRMALTIAACALTTLVATPLLDYLDLANIVMLFLLTVLLIAVKLGRNEAILASVLSVALFDIFFVPPRFSLAVSDIQYLVTFAVMLATALITTHLATGLKRRAQEAQLREQQTQALYQFARQLAGTLTVGQVAEISRAFVKAQFSADSAVLLPDAAHHLNDADQTCPLRIEKHLAQVALESGQMIRNNEMSSLGYASFYLPLRASMRSRGVLAVAYLDDAHEITTETSSLFEALASLIAVALERLHYVEVAQSTEVKMLTERLRSSILSAISHDLRTPLTALVGLADSLFLIKPALPATALETAQALHEQAARLAGLVGNLLDMARLNAGEVKLRREWQLLEEVIGASIKLLGNALEEHPVKVRLAPDLPLIEFDAVLIERVFCNLLENAAKYSPKGCAIELSAAVKDEVIEVMVADQGPGFPEGHQDELFNMFVRGEAVTGKPGSGLGLAICKAIVEAHGGWIAARNRLQGGGCVRFALPKGKPPVVEDEKP